MKLTNSENMLHFRELESGLSEIHKKKQTWARHVKRIGNISQFKDYLIRLRIWYALEFRVSTFIVLTVLIFQSHLEQIVNASTACIYKSESHKVDWI